MECQNVRPEGQIFRHSYFDFDIISTFSDSDRQDIANFSFMVSECRFWDCAVEAVFR